MVKALAFVLALMAGTEKEKKLDSLPTYEMPEVIVTASRIAQPYEKVVWPVEVIGSGKSDYGDLSEALSRSLASDVRSYGYRGHAAFGLLGGITASRVLVLSDGIPMNTRRDGVIDLSLIPLASGDRVEIVRGPLSALYGSSAIGGVVNVLSSVTNGISGSYEITDQLGMDAGFTGGLGRERFGFRAAGSWLSLPGFRANDDVTRLGAKASVWAAPFRRITEGIQLGLDVGYTWRELGIPGPQPDTTDSSYTPPTFGNSLVTSLYDRQQDNLFSTGLRLSYHRKGFEGLAHLYGVGQAFSYDWRYQGLRSDWTPYTVLETDQYNDLRLGSDVQLTARLPKGVQLTGGLAASREMLEVNQLASDSAADTLVKELSWDASDLALAAWIEGIMSIRAFTPTLAVRMDWYPRYGALFSPEAGVNVTLIPEKLILRAAYGQAFRAPTFNDLYWPRDAYGSGDSTLVPERGQNASLNLEASPIEAVSFEVTAYGKDITKMISWVPDSFGFWKPTNIDKVVVLGADAGIRFSLMDSLVSFSLSAAYNHAVETRAILVYSDWMTGETRTDTITRQAAFVPPLAVKGRLGLNLWKGGSVVFSATWTDKRLNYYADYTQAPVVGVQVKEIKPSLKMDLVLAQKLFKIVTCEIGVRNILNDRTAQQFGTSYNDLNYPTAPRNFYAAISVNYR